MMIMKKILFTLLLSVVLFPLIAQPRKVAITEVYDKSGYVDEVTKSMIRTRLTRAISSKQGYMALERVDVSSILNEHGFQQTGLVDASTAQQLGRMTGANLILVTEAMMRGTAQVYVTAKMIDVTTGQITITEDCLMYTSSIDKGCDELANKIFGSSVGGGSFGSASGGSGQVVTLYNYLRVFPSDIGEFQSSPATLIAHINNANTHGYNTWRLPTSEELSVMRAAASQIPGFRNASYMTSDRQNPGVVRLVTTEEQTSVRQQQAATAAAATREQAARLREPAICALLGVSPGSCYIDTSLGLAIYVNDTSVYFYRDRSGTQTTPTPSGAWRWPTANELRQMGKYLSRYSVYAYGTDMEFSSDSRADHIVFYFDCYYPSEGATRRKVSGRYSDYYNSGPSWKRTPDVDFKTRWVCDLPSESAIQAKIQEMMNR